MRMIDDVRTFVDESPLPEESLLVEYQASEDSAERALFYRDREYFRHYWERGWLKLDFEHGQPCIRATHFVGLMPVRSGEKHHLLMVAPKGCSFDSPNNPLGLLRFLELAAIADGGESIPEPQGFSGKLGRNAFVAILAGYYGQLLQDLCRRDYRNYFKVREEDLNGRVKGRIHTTRHIRNALHGREHRIPCRWEEFSPDNWDNRILLGAIRRLEETAKFLSPEASRYIKSKFLGLEPWFSSVQEVSIRSPDFSKAQLWRTSRYYRRALDWARLILQGFARPVAGGAASPLILDANDIFEQFAKIVTRGAINSTGEHSWEFCVPTLKLFQGSKSDRIPDLGVRSHQTIVAVGDAKYKDILEQSVSSDALGDLQNVIVPKISSSDWNQLYVYLRLASATHGFFVVPFWNPTGKHAELITTPNFEVSPLDHPVTRGVKVAVLGLNLLRPLHQVRREAVPLLARWLKGLIP